MSTIRAWLAVEGLSDVGFQFFTQNSAIGSRSESGVTDEGDGWYSVTGVTLQGDHVRWDSTGTTNAIAREDLAVRLLLEAMPASVWANGTRTLSSFGTLVADVATAVWAAATRTLSAFGFTVDTNANATETAIKSKTDNLPAAPAAVGDIPSANITAIKAKTDNLPGSPAAVGSAMTLAADQAVNVTKINGASVLGAGTSGDLWRGS